MSDHQKEIETWRQQRLGRLRSDEGWLVLAGLFFLEEGDNAVGSGEGSGVPLPAHSAAPHVGNLRLVQGQPILVPAAGVTLSVGGQVIPAGQERPLKTDKAGPAEVVSLGDLRFFVIERDGRQAVRLRDLQNPRRAQFPGLPYFPIDAQYRVTAQLVPHDKPGTTIPITGANGKLSAMKSPGKLVFALHGQTLALDAVQEDFNETRLFILFRDQTAGHETYGAGRFLYSDGLPDSGGRVVLDFNKAYNPPCALTPFATCPLPPPQNRLPVRIEAGEKLPTDAGL